MTGQSQQDKADEIKNKCLRAIKLLNKCLCAIKLLDRGLRSYFCVATSLFYYQLRNEGRSRWIPNTQGLKNWRILRVSPHHSTGALWDFKLGGNKVSVQFISITPIKASFVTRGRCMEAMMVQGMSIDESESGWVGSRRGRLGDELDRERWGNGRKPWCEEIAVRNRPLAPPVIWLVSARTKVAFSFKEALKNFCADL